jgi:hypothetical protein
MLKWRPIIASTKDMEHDIFYLAEFDFMNAQHPSNYLLSFAFSLLYYGVNRRSRMTTYSLITDVAALLTLLSTVIYYHSSHFLHHSFCC